MKKLFFISTAFLSVAGVVFAQNSEQPKKKLVLNSFQEFISEFSGDSRAIKKPYRTQNRNRRTSDQDYDPNWDYDLGSEQKESFSIEAYYGIAVTDLYSKNDIDGINIAGVNFIISTPLSVDFESSNLALSCFGLLGVGGGKKNYDWGEGYEYSMTNIHSQAALGFSLDWMPTESLTISPRARVGLSVVNYKAQDEHVPAGEEKSEDEDDTAAGLYYGVGIGANFNINDYHSLGFGVDYIGSTARPEFGEGEDKVKFDAQSYVAVSASYTYKF